MPKSMSGIVSSDKGDKTIVVTIAARKTHPIYKKQYTRTVRLMAHDANNEAKVGDKVVIVETRPISAKKRFKLEQIIEKGGVSFKEEDATSDIPVQEKPEKSEAKPKPSDEKKDKDEKKTEETK